MNYPYKHYFFQWIGEVEEVQIPHLIYVWTRAIFFTFTLIEAISVVTNFKYFLLQSYRIIQVFMQACMLKLLNENIFFFLADIWDKVWFCSIYSSSMRLHFDVFNYIKSLSALRLFFSHTYVIFFLYLHIFICIWI